MSGLNVTLHGFADLERRLKTLANAEATKAGQAAIRAGGAVARKKIEAAAPLSAVAEGHLQNRKRKSGAIVQEAHRKIVNWIKVKKTRSKSSTEVQVSVGATKAYQASFVEFGSIRNAPQPFMRTAFDQNHQAIIDAIAKVLEKQLIKRGA